MMDHEVIYERNLTRSYMKISATGSGKFDEKILLKRKLNGLLSIELCYYDGSPWYWYNITGKQSLDTYCKIQSLQKEFVERMILSICDEVEILEWNLLDENCLVLDPEYIFISNVNQEIIFTAYPGNRDNLAGQFQGLMEYMLTKIDHSDIEEIKTAYAIYEKSLDEAYSLVDLRNTIVMNRKTQRETTKMQDGFDRTGAMQQLQNLEGASKFIESEDTNNEKVSAFETIKRNIIFFFREQTKEYGKTMRMCIAHICGKDQKEESKKTNFKQRMKGESIVTPSIVYPDEPVQTPQPQIHPTVCLASYHVHPKGVLIYEGGDKISDIPLEQKEKKIGKSDQADVRIVRDTISQFHAKIDYQGEEYYLEDLNSTNGTFVNEEPLAYKERRKLQSDDIVRFADVRFRFL